MADNPKYTVRFTRAATGERTLRLVSTDPPTDIPVRIFFSQSTMRLDEQGLAVLVLDALEQAGMINMAPMNEAIALLRELRLGEGRSLSTASAPWIARVDALLKVVDHER